MKPAPFQYFAPVDMDEALSLLAEYGQEAKLLAGGQSLIPTMNFRLSQPAVIIDLNRISELNYIRENKSGGLCIGAMTRQRQLERSDAVARKAPLVYETMPFIAHPQIRNRGTVGGSLAHADPAAEFPAVFSALNARFRLRSQNGERRVSVDDFFTGMFSTALEADEMLVEIETPPLPPRSGCAFREVARRHGDYAIVGIATAVTLDKKDRCQEAKIVFLSVGEGPVQARQAAGILKNETPTAEIIRAAAEAAALQDIDPGDDLHASAAYRRHLANTLTTQALTLAFERASQ
jgi:carbon-monoxide dehydrogenase medium subunit